MKNKVHLILIIISITLSAALVMVKHNFGSVLSAITSPQPLTFLFVGDVMLGRSVNGIIQANQDAGWPFHYVADQLKEADITIGNLESPLIPNCPVRRDGMIFCGDSSNALGLKYAGFDYVSLANNHSYNYGISGQIETTQSLTKYGITPVLQGQIIYGYKSGTTFAILALDDVTRKLDDAELISQIKLARIRADLVFVIFHWGKEYMSRSNDRQRSLAHQSIDAGASAVIGAHPHVIQESELYLGKPIYYSLGNFVFDQEWSNETKKGLAIQLTYNGAQLTKTEEFPLLIKDYGQPHWQ